jgi:hypothetical protein
MRLELSRGALKHSFYLSYALQGFLDTVPQRVYHHGV